MADYIPTTDPEKINWLKDLALWLDANGLAHGFTQQQIDDFQAMANDSDTAYADHLAAQLVARAATVNKNTVMGNTIAIARDYAQKLQHDLSMTDAERAAAGITVPDPTKTATAAQAILELLPPLLSALVPTVLRGNAYGPRIKKTSLHSHGGPWERGGNWSPNPGDEHRNAKPTGVMGCEIQYAKGGVPTEETAWISLGLDTESPMIHNVTETTPTTYTYRARYVSKNLHYGNFGDPAECTVSV